MYVLFPTLVHEDYLQQDNRSLESEANKIFNNLKEPSSDWRCSTITSLNQYELKDNTMFAQLLSAISSRVDKFSKEFGCNGNVKLIDSWINIAPPGAFQEYHIHTNSHFSIAYYIKAAKNSGNIVFRSAEADTDMYSLPVKELTPASFKTMSLPPDEGKLYIFRSNLKHMVEQNNSDQDRISISANFVIE